MTDTCPCCGQPIPETDPVTQLLARCRDLGVAAINGSLVTEAGAAALLGYASADTLRKQATEGRNLFPFVRRGNRRLYRLSDIAAAEISAFR